jgi:hypothetical protein
MLLGRFPERAALGRLLEAARAGGSAVLVLRGEPGAGKAALLEYVIESASGFATARTRPSTVNLSSGILRLTVRKAECEGRPDDGPVARTAVASAEDVEREPWRATALN